MAMLRKRIKDEKTNVRKSALQVGGFSALLQYALFLETNSFAVIISCHTCVFQVLVCILKHCDILNMEKDLSVLQDHCRDPAVSVRKQALQSLTELLMVRGKALSA